MAKLTKRRKLVVEKLEAGKTYSVEEAVSLLAEFGSKKFKESIDVAVNLGVDPRKSDQVVRGSTLLPNGTGKEVRVAVFAQGENAEKATKLRGQLLDAFSDKFKNMKGPQLAEEVDMILLKMLKDSEDR